MTYKYCQKCGKAIPSDSKFCPFCDTHQADKKDRKTYREVPGVRINGNQIMLVHHRRISVFSMKMITLITIMLDIIVMVLFAGNWESVAVNVKAIGSAPIVIYILFTLWTAWIEYYFGERMSRRYSDLMLWFVGVMALVAFAFLIAGTTI